MNKRIALILALLTLLSGRGFCIRTEQIDEHERVGEKADGS